MRHFKTLPAIDLEMQCWLLTACCALYPEQHASYPELRALRKAIQERDRPTVAVALEVVGSHLKDELSPRQLQLTRRLACCVRSGDYRSTRNLVVALARASFDEQRRAC